MNYNDLFPEKFISADAFQGRTVTLTLKGLAHQDMPGEDGTETKPVASFEETKKMWVLNKTTGQCLRAMFGNETNDWIGKKVTLFAAPWRNGEICIRVYGSPDIQETFKFDVKLGQKGSPQKRHISTTMNKVEKKQRKQQQREPGSTPDNVPPPHLTQSIPDLAPHDGCERQPREEG